MKFYRIDTSGMFMNRKYAYLSVNNKNQIKYKEKHIEEVHELYTCPYCGFKSNEIFYPGVFVQSV